MFSADVIRLSHSAFYFLASVTTSSTANQILFREGSPAGVWKARTRFRQFSVRRDICSRRVEYAKLPGGVKPTRPASLQEQLAVRIAGTGPSQHAPDQSLKASWMIFRLIKSTRNVHFGRIHMPADSGSRLCCVAWTTLFRRPMASPLAAIAPC